jgi:hypothetical protein
MDTITLIVYTISALGLAYIVGQSAITKSIRQAYANTRRPLDLFRCSICVKDNPLDDPKSFNFIRMQLPMKRGELVCPHGDEQHAAGLRMLKQAEDPFFLQLIECPACFGFWIGLCAAVASTFAHIGGPIIMFLPLYTAGANFLLGRATGLINHPNEEP